MTEKHGSPSTKLPERASISSIFSNEASGHLLAFSFAALFVKTLCCSQFILIKLFFTAVSRILAEACYLFGRLRYCMSSCTELTVAASYFRYGIFSDIIFNTCVKIAETDLEAFDLFFSFLFRGEAFFFLLLPGAVNPGLFYL